MTWDWEELLEVWCEEYSPETFFEQTARTFIAAMNGRRKAQKRNAERDLILAYNTGAFSRATKVKPLNYYMNQLRGAGKRSASADALSFFGKMKAAGFPVSIKRVPRATSSTPGAGASPRRNRE